MRSADRLRPSLLLEASMAWCEIPPSAVRIFADAPLDRTRDIAVTARSRIALIHAVTVAMQPIDDALARLWPQAERVYLLDDARSADRAKAADLTPVVSCLIALEADGFVCQPQVSLA
jgi:hypothetical protein